MAQPSQVLTPEARERFFEHLAATCNVSASAEAVGVSRQRVYQVREEDSDFADAWDSAIEQGTDALEAEARRRAMEGVSEAVYYKGEIVGYIQKYSDTLMQTLLRGHRPWRYRERVELSGDPEKPIKTEQEIELGPKARAAAKVLGEAMAREIGD